MTFRVERREKPRRTKRPESKCPHKRWRLVARPEMSFQSGTHGRSYDSICTNCKGMA